MNGDFNLCLASTPTHPPTHVDVPLAAYTRTCTYITLLANLAGWLAGDAHTDRWLAAAHNGRGWSRAGVGLAVSERVKERAREPANESDNA